MVITKDSESFDPGSSPGRTFLHFFWKLVFGSLANQKARQLQRFRVHSSAVERRIADPEFAGSIPAAPFSFAFFAMHTFRARVPFAEWKAWGIGLVV